MLNLIIHKKVNLDDQKKKSKLFCIFCVAETLTNILYSMCNFNMLIAARILPEGIYNCILARNSFSNKR